MRAKDRTGKDESAAIVEGGQERARRALHADVAREVEAEYEATMRDAAWWPRIRLWLEMRREIRPADR